MVELSNAEEAWVVAENELRATKKELADFKQKVSDAAIRSTQLHEKTKKELQGVKQELADFRQEVSGVVTSLCNTVLVGRDHSRMRDMLSHRFIIPAPKPDPLVDVAKMMGYFNTAAKHWAGDVRAALDDLGLEIREKNGG